ncbi:Membrane_transport family protein [Hexamita inflata]|uniref:Membrane transport family protein n=1 Tax=Hexamita inflata TaxID=28002 RepID=A0AA86UIA2_9EUKA|nr:Membrane transport family protein [Hexamita inflata]
MTLIISILNGILPVIFYVLVGYFLAHANVFPRDKYQVLLTLTFNVFFPISTIYSLGRKEILSEDFLIIIAYYIASLCTMLICMLITPLLFKTDRRFGFAHTCSCTLMQNLIVTGLPIVQGFYDPIEAEKYSFITVFAQFTSTIPICFFLFEYAKLREKSDPNFKVILKVILQSIWNTLKNPMIVSIFIALIYNVLKQKFFPSLKQLPTYIEPFFNSCRALVSVFGVVSIGVFSQNEVHKIKQKIKSVKRTNSVLNLIIFLVIRHIVFPVFQIMFMKQFGLNKQITKVNSAIATCNTALQAFNLADSNNFEPGVAGMMVLIGMAVDVAIIPLLGILVEKIYLRE